MPGVELGSAFVPIRADVDQLKKDLDGAEGTVKNALGNMAKVAAGVGLGLAAAFAGATVAAFNLGATFDDAYDTIRAGTGKAGEELEGLKNDFKAVVADVPADFDKASAVVAELNKRTGATGETLQDLSKNILEFSRITGTDAVTNVASATRMFGDWSIATEDQAGSLDMVFRASQATGIGVDTLMGKVVQFGAPLRAMGFSIEESAAMLGKWEKEGVNTELVLGSMRIAMGKFADAGIPAREGLDQTIAKLTEMGPSAEATALAMDVFGARAGPDMAAAILEGRFALGELFDQVANGSETVQSAAADTADGAERMKVAMNRVQLALEPVGSAVFNLQAVLIDKLAPALEGALTAAGPMIAAFAEGLAPALDTVIETLGGLIQVFAERVLPVLTAVGGMVGEQLRPLLAGLATAIVLVVVPAFIAWATTATAAAAATIVALAPVLVPLAAISLAVGALVYAWESDFGGIQTKTKEVWASLQPVFEAVRAALTVFFTTTLPELLTSWQGTWDKIRGALQGAFDLMTLGIRTWWTLVSGLFAAAQLAFQGDWQGAWDKVKGTFSAAWDEVKRVLGTVMEGLKETFRNAGGALLGLLKQGLDAAWGGVIANVQGGVGRIAALLPHSYADEGPLSEVVSWKDVLWGDLRTEMPALTTAFETGTDAIALEFTGMRKSIQTDRMLIAEELTGLQTAFTTTASNITVSAAQLEEAMRSFNGGGGGSTGNGLLDSYIAGTPPTLTEISESQSRAMQLNAGTMAWVDRQKELAGGTQPMVIELDGQAVGRALAPYVEPSVAQFSGSRVGGV
jgi:phage-related minor tail protein